MKKTRKNLGTPLSHEESVKRTKIIKRVKVVIKSVGLMLLFFFGWLNIKDYSYSLLLNDAFSEVLLKGSLAFYYTSWILGSSADLNDEEYTLLVAPNSGKLTWMAISIIILMGGLFGILCWTDDLKYFSISLFLFLLIDKLGNVFLNRFIRYSIEESKKTYMLCNNYIGYLSLLSVQNFLTGKYIKWRFTVGFVLIITMILYSFTNLPNIVAEILQLDSPKIIFSIIFFVYVLTIEIWVWKVRLKRRVYFQILNEINQDYILRKR